MKATNAAKSVAAAATDRGGDCTDSCFTRGDGYCDDGGLNSDYEACDFGTDCDDCGRRAGCLYLMPVMALSSLISVSSAVA